MCFSKKSLIFSIGCCGDVSKTSTPHRKFQKIFWDAHRLQKFWKNSWLLMVKIHFCEYFRIFGSNVHLGKNTLETRKSLLSDDHISKQGLVPKFLPYESYYICKELYPAKFLGNLKMRDKSYVGLKMPKNAIFTKMDIFKWLCLQNYATKCNLAHGILKVLKKPFKSLLLNVFNFKFWFLSATCFWPYRVALKRLGKIEVSS